ncbi:PAS domain-containing protein [Methanoculleus chikugoensis]|uniref:PAS domain-containing protein n=1 Tax=Methanoculleus chikugoensis TaxID=118126 RepID=UPI0006CFD5BB|nr:PAS domain-containing protein [Methanoculleus chikugoensis]
MACLPTRQSPAGSGSAGPTAWRLPPSRKRRSKSALIPRGAGNLHPEDAGTVLARWERCNDAGLPWRCNYRIRDADGGYRTIASRGIPVRDATGRIVLWAGVDLDVTVRDEPCWQTRELCTLSAVARAIEGGADAGEVFPETAALLPRGFRHPEQVSVRIVPGIAVPGGPEGLLPG